MTQSETKQTIPTFQCRAEEAAFWDSHDVGELWDELQPVALEADKPLSAGLTIRLDRETLAELRRRARELGIGPSTLVRMWILEHLRPESRSG